MSRRTFAEVQTLTTRLGRDLGLSWAGPAGAFTDGDLAEQSRQDLTRQVRDLNTVAGVDQAVQFLVNRLMTRKGELAPLGHPDYGSRHHELIGEPNTERTRNVIKIHVLEALRHEPRVAKVLRCVVDAGSRPRETVRIVIDVRLIDEPTPLNLVVPFELGQVS